METLKQQINKLSELQRSLKPQRKTVHFTGERTVEPYEAAWKALTNGEILRQLNIVAALRHGKTYDQVERNPKEPFTESQIEKILEKWKDFM